MLSLNQSFNICPRLPPPQQIHFEQYRCLRSGIVQRMRNTSIKKKGVAVMQFEDVVAQTIIN